MNALNDISDNIARALDTMTEGWRQLRERAGTALTRFNPLQRRPDIESSDEQIMRQASRWGVLAADLRETAKDIRVRLEVPGMEADKFDIQVVGNMLRIRGEKHLHHESDNGRFHLLECAYGAFERQIPLPVEVDDSAAKANYRRGVLEIILPKTRSSQSHRIDVEG